MEQAALTGADSERAKLLLAAMVDELASGPERHLPDPRWEATFRRVPRHHFVSGFYVRSEDPERRWEYVDPATDAERWMRLVYSDDLLVTRIDDYERPLSSTSMPRMMARFLHLLDVHDESTVLEIGTGTGYNAAVLCERLGSQNVTSIDIDGPLVEAARTALAGLGYTPEVAVADGRRGYPPRAPYDRIVSTASTSRVPAAWVEQLRPGGVIVTPLLAPVDDGLVALRRQEDGRLEGRLHPEGVQFMPLREAVHEYGQGDPLWRELLELVYEPEGEERPWPMPAWLEDPWSPGEGRDVLRLLQLHLEPDLHWFWFDGPARPRTLPGIVSRQDRSWLRVRAGSDGATTVREGGPRRLTESLAEALELWARLGRPGMDRYGWTVHPNGRQCVWLDRPDAGQVWELPAAPDP